MARGLAGMIPASWKHADDNASLEIWLTIDGAMAICGMRLSDRTMRHRTYKEEHLPASDRADLILPIPIDDVTAADRVGAEARSHFSHDGAQISGGQDILLP